MVRYHNELVLSFRVCIRISDLSAFRTEIMVSFLPYHTNSTTIDLHVTFDDRAFQVQFKVSDKKEQHTCYLVNPTEDH